LCYVIVHPALMSSEVSSVFRRDLHCPLTSFIDWKSKVKLLSSLA
jgi:hypothetical protein